MVAGALVLAISGDLPFGMLASPGAGMLPTLVVVLMMGFGLVLLARGRHSPPLGALDWADLPHAARVLAVAAVAATLYVPLGFVLTTTLLLLALAFLVERRPFLPAVAFSVGVMALVYVLFVILLRTPLPRGLIGS